MRKEIRILRNTHGTFLKAKPIPPSFLCALCCVVAIAEIIMDIGNL